MIGGYKTHFAGVCPFEGVKTRRMLNAPISLDFKHSIGGASARPLDLRNRITVTCYQQVAGFVYVISSPTYCGIEFRHNYAVSDFMREVGDYTQEHINKDVNDIMDKIASQIAVFAKIEVMRTYQNAGLQYFACNRERYWLDSVNQNV